MSTDDEKLKLGNLFDLAGVSLDEEVFQTLVDKSGFHLQRIVSHGQATPADQWYDQDQDEWVVLLAGNATLRFADPDETVQLLPGDFVAIFAHRRHRVESTASDQPTVWLALHHS
jgi:cupin 2 domain-containing protein